MQAGLVLNPLIICGVSLVLSNAIEAQDAAELAKLQIGCNADNKILPIFRVVHSIRDDKLVRVSLSDIVLAADQLRACHIVKCVKA